MVVGSSGSFKVISFGGGGYLLCFKNKFLFSPFTNQRLKRLTFFVMVPKRGWFSQHVNVCLVPYFYRSSLGMYIFQPSSPAFSLPFKCEIIVERYVQIKKQLIK